MGTNTSPSHRDTRDVLDAIRRIVQALRESSRSAERHVGLTGAQLFVLHTLAATPALALNDLAAGTHTHQSSVSTVVTRLVDQGLVRRGQSTVDARRLALSLTAKGRRLANRAPDAAQQRLVQAIERLTAARRRMLASTMTELAQSVTAADRIPAMFFEERARPARKVRRHA
jgi:DNA-binding MarR family transcriptional regulator